MSPETRRCAANDHGDASQVCATLARTGAIGVIEGGLVVKCAPATVLQGICYPETELPRVTGVGSNDTLVVVSFSSQVPVVIHRHFMSACGGRVVVRRTLGVAPRS